MLPLLRELGDLKRVRSAGRAGSIAERLFADAWSRLAAGEPVETVMRTTVVNGLAAARLGDLDSTALEAAGVPPNAVRDIRRGAVAAVSAEVAPWAGAWVDDAGPPAPVAAAGSYKIPRFVAPLCAQPRAGATCPGRGRLMFDPTENHAEHCAVVAIIGVLLAPCWDAEPQTVFLAGLAHHLHNAVLPDAGFAGETLLGEWLAPAMAQATRLALAELDDTPRNAVTAALRILPDAETAAGRAFHAADTLDRVLQIEHHLRAAGTSMAFVQREMALVHAGPVKPFQDALLARMELAA